MVSALSSPATWRRPMPSALERLRRVRTGWVLADKYFGFPNMREEEMVARLLPLLLRVVEAAQDACDRMRSNVRWTGVIDRLDEALAPLTQEERDAWAKEG